MTYLEELEAENQRLRQVNGGLVRTNATLTVENYQLRDELGAAVSQYTAQALKLAQIENRAPSSGRVTVDTRFMH